MKTIEKVLESCKLCPRACGVNRNHAAGRCGAGRWMEVSKIMLHRWEEPCISGSDADGGSGAVFFTHCPLGCVYCQNREISRADSVGKRYSEEELAAEFCNLQKSGAFNINLVSPTHYTVQLVRAVQIARERGLTLPVVWNTGGYETLETLELLRDTVDVFLCDYKYGDAATAGAYSDAADYPITVEKAIDRMIGMVGECQFDAREMLQKGVIVRHLVLPGERAESIRILENMAAHGWADKILLALMAQYTPEFLPEAEEADRFAKIRRRVTTFEYESVAKRARELHFDGYFQSRESATKKYTPDFDR